MNEKLVIIESCRTEDHISGILYARKCVRDSLLVGESPVSFHLLYSQPGVVCDDMQNESFLGVDSRDSWIRRAEKLVLYVNLGFSDDMLKSVRVAEKLNVPVEYRKLEESEQVNLKILFFDAWQDHFGHWLSGLAAYLKICGHSYDVCASHGFPDTASLDRYDLVFVWNAEYESARFVKDYCAISGIPCYVVEVGWFPQKDFFFIDPIGINAKSSIMDDDLSWVTESHVKRMKKFAERYLNGRIYSGKDKYILCPLQLDDDTNIKCHSPFRKMQDFICHVEDTFSGNIIFKRHPLDKKTYVSSYDIVTDGSFLDIAQDASLVYGINSTCLLESAMMGVPTKAIGRGYLTGRDGNFDKLLAALVSKQIPVDRTDLDFWVRGIVDSAISVKARK